MKLNKLFAEKSALERSGGGMSRALVECEPGLQEVLVKILFGKPNSPVLSGFHVRSIIAGRLAIKECSLNLNSTILVAHVDPHSDKTEEDGNPLATVSSESALLHLRISMRL